MLTRKRYGKTKIVIIRLISLFLILSIGFFCLFEFKARELVHNTVDNELEIHATNAIDNAVYAVLSDVDVQYNSLVYEEKSETGAISSLRTDSKAINMLKSKMSLAITEGIRNAGKASVKIPSGAFTGLVLLSDVGPDITVKLQVDGSAVTTIKSEFNSAGINQTIHRIYMIVDADVSLTCPIISYETNIVSEFELCQTVIVGNTPQFYASMT